MGRRSSGSSPERMPQRATPIAVRRTLLALALLTGACAPATGVTPPASTRPPTPSPTHPAAVLEFAPPADAATVDGGCGTTRMWKGTVPPALESAAAQNAPHGPPVAIARPAILAGFVFGYPLRAGHPESPSNKVLWVVSVDRSGPLVVDAHPLDAAMPSVHYAFPDNSGPGNIYPSLVDVPTQGCWHLTFAWGTGRAAEMDLLYR